MNINTNMASVNTHCAKSSMLVLEVFCIFSSIFV